MSSPEFFGLAFVLIIMGGIVRYLYITNKDRKPRSGRGGNPSGGSGNQVEK